MTSAAPATGSIGMAAEGASGPQDLALARRVGVTHLNPHQETVQLRLGQRVGPVILDGVLSGDDHEGFRQRIGTTFDCGLPLVHGLEQSGLRFRRGAINFVGQQDVGENRTRLKLEFLASGTVDGDAQHVARQHVAGELDALEAAGEALGQGLRQSGFPDARDIFDQQVTAGEQANHRQSHGFGFSTNDRSERLLESDRLFGNRRECRSLDRHDLFMILESRQAAGLLDLERVHGRSHMLRACKIGFTLI